MSAETIAETYNSIKAHLKALEDISRRLEIYKEASDLLAKLQRDMDEYPEIPSSEFPKLNLSDPRPSRIGRILMKNKRPCKSFVLESGRQNTYEAIFTTLNSYMSNYIDGPLDTLETHLQERMSIRDTRNPHFEIPLGKIHAVCMGMLENVYAFNAATSGHAWMLHQDGPTMLEHLRHYNCAGELDQVAVEQARRFVSGAQYVVLRIGDVGKLMRKADRV
jgi:hypothetical protein